LRDTLWDTYFMLTQGVKPTFRLISCETRLHVDNIPKKEYIVFKEYLMNWNVEYTDEFDDWWNSVIENVQDDIAATVELLAESGPNLKFPHSSGIEGSRHSHMRELRVQSGGNPVRIFYAFDPVRSAILLIGGDKTGDKRFYDTCIPVADKLYDEHLEELKCEGVIR